MFKSVLAVLSLLSLAGTSLACTEQDGIKLTAFGWPDAHLTPKFKCHGDTVVKTVPGDKTALGDGSYSKPYAAAIHTKDSIFRKCELIYIPLLEKYFRISDDCSGCSNKWIDLYIVQENRDVGQHPCELAFGTFNYGRALHEIIRNPASGYLTNKKPLFENGKCYNDPKDGRVFPKRDGTFRCGKAALASPDSVPNVDDQFVPSPFDDDPAGRHKPEASPTPLAFRA